MTTARISILIAFLLTAAQVTPARAQAQDCKALWERRAVAGEPPLPDGQAARDALGCFERELRAHPDDLKLQFSVLEARYFVGHFVASEGREKRELFEVSLELNQKMLDELTRKSGNPQLAELPAAEQAQILKGIPEAAAVHFWASINWGLWAMANGYFNAARKNAAEKIRDHAQMVRLLDNTYSNGGGLRLLGRLYTVTPKIPLATGWIDRSEGVRMLEEAVALSTADPRNELYLAEALLKYNRRRRDEAVAMLERVAKRPPDPSRLVEDWESIGAARKDLELLTKGEEEL